MPAFLNRYATPLTTGLFLVSLISGIALFFHWQSGWFHSMHEILSMLLIAPFILHIWRNWRPMTSYLRHAPMAIALVLSLGAALAFAIPAATATGAGGRGGPPQMALVQKMLAAPLPDVAPVLGLSADALADKLEAAGFTLPAPGASLAEIAKASGRSTVEIAGPVTR